MSAVAQRQPEIIENAPGQIVPLAATTPMQMLAQAIDRGMSPEVIDKLMSLGERWDKTQARKAFDVAIARAKAEIPVIKKTAAGHNNKYADLAAIARVVDPIIAKHGLSYRFRTAQTDKISVTCVLSHEAGHFEENTLTGMPDKGPGRNDIQAIGSALTYLQRYSLVQALGIAASEDDDGKAGGNGSAETISDDQVFEINKLLTDTKSNLTLFLKKIGLESLTQIRADKFDAVVKLINDTAAKRAALAAKQGTQS
jgi:hypothetical protein